MDEQQQPAANAAVPAATGAKPAAAPVRIAVVTSHYGEVRRLPAAEAQAMLDAGTARRATEVDLAIGG